MQNWSVKKTRCHDEIRFSFKRLKDDSNMVKRVLYRQRLNPCGLARRVEKLEGVPCNGISTPFRWSGSLR